MTTSSTKDDELVYRVKTALLDAAAPLAVYDDLAHRDTAEILARAARQALSQSHGEVRAAALEEAAKIADVEYDKVRIGDGEFGGGRANASRIIAGQIRALSKQCGTP